MPPENLSPSLAAFGPIQDPRAGAVRNEPVPTEAGLVSGVAARDPSFTVYKRTARSIRALAVICLAANAAMAQTATARIVSAANIFLSTLDQKQRESVLFAFDDEQQRVRWSNLPDRWFRRAGLSMGELNARAAFRRTGAGFVRAQPQGFREGSADRGGRRGSQDQRTEQPDVRQGSLLHLDPWNAFGKRSLDAAVWRPSSGAQHHHRRRAMAFSRRA